MRRRVVATIARTPEDVFDRLADPVQDAGWWATGVVTEAVDAGPPAVGTHYRRTATIDGREVERLRIVELDRPRSVAWVGTGPVADTHGRYEFEPTNGGTRVSLTVELAPKGWWRLATPFMWMFTRLGNAELRERLEAAFSD